ncbi:MAG: fatty acid desaturase [Actinomycetota bacterium]|nr:fatty acid desaturase [Actinomycetota bacterium]
MTTAETQAQAEPNGSQIESPLKHLTEEQISELAKEFDAIHDEVYSDLGEHDRRYITSMIEMHRRLAVMARVFLLAARHRPAWVAGTAANSAAKILENMEIGHNVMHGQWDWMNDPHIHSSTWDWDTASTAEAWKHSHNYIHHTFTNIRGKDKDLGYEIMRIDPHQKWHPVYVFQPLYNILLMALFEWGVAFHDLDLEAVRKGEKDKKQVIHELKGIGVKARDQFVKDYVAWPAISSLAAGAADLLVGRDPKRALARGRETFKQAATANATANVARNLWSHAIIFCGHFPDQTYTFTPEETEDESRGAWYVRQLVGAANIEGGPFFHVASGNLGYQVEHHLFPDMPSSRYAQIAPRVKDICERYELPYNTGPFFRQWGMVNRTILRLAFPGGKPRPKPGPYRGGEGRSRPGANGSGTVRSREPEPSGPPYSP